MADGVNLNRPYLIEMEAEPSVQENDFVYRTTLGTAGQALASSINTMPCIGYVVKKKGNKVYITERLLEKDILNIEPTKTYYISTEHAGKLQDFKPLPVENHVVQPVALGLANNRLHIFINPFNAVIRSSP